MKRHRVILSKRARADLRSIRRWITDAGAPKAAEAFLGRIKNRLAAFDVASERGDRHDHILDGLRVVGIGRRVSVAFKVEGDDVLVLRVLYGGEDWMTSMQEHLPEDDR